MRPAISVCLLACCGLLGPASAHGDIDMQLSPNSLLGAVGEIVTIDFVLSSDGSEAELFSATRAIIEWDPAALQLQGFTLNPDADFVGLPLFPSFSCDLNVSFEDGDALLSVNGIGLAAPPPPGFLVGTFQFLGLTEAIGTSVDLISQVPEPPAPPECRSIVVGPFGDATGQDSDSTAVQVLCDSDVGDVNGSGDIEQEDLAASIPVLLGQDTDPAHQAAVDANCDGLVDGRDIAILVVVFLHALES